MYNIDGLSAGDKWLRLSSEVWYNEQRPNDLGGTWSTDVDYPDMDMFTSTGWDFARDIYTTDRFQQALSMLYGNVGKDFGRGGVPPIGYSFDGPQQGYKFTLQDSATEGKYNAVDWFLGSFRLNLTAISRDQKNHIAGFQVTLINYSGWESATREPGRFVNDFGVSILPNRGGRPTSGKTVLDPMNPLIYPIWSTQGKTFGQIFTWRMSISFPYHEPAIGPR